MRSWDRRNDERLSGSYEDGVPELMREELDLSRETSGRVKGVPRQVIGVGKSSENPSLRKGPVKQVLSEEVG